MWKWSALLLWPLCGANTAMAAESGQVGAAPQMSFGFAWAPRWGSYGDLDEQLVSYDFAPVGGRMMQGIGLRGRAYSDAGVYGELAMTFGIRSGSVPLATTTTNIETGGGVGFRHRSGVQAGVLGGFATLTQALASETGGGVLIYQGPSVHPQIGWTVFPQPGMGPALGILVGYNALFPVGSAHHNPLWEKPFERSVVQAFTLTLESGFGLSKAAP